MPIAKDELSKNAMGGTELMKYKLAEIVEPSLLDNFQIFVSRVQEELSPDHIRILWFQDLADDPASQHLANGGWQKFHKFVFVSNWQMRGYIERFDIPWSRCVVINNSIEPIPLVEKSYEKIKLVYTSTPHRGLQLLYPVFDKLSQDFDNIELDVFSSFKIYGWGERDEEFKQLFKALEDHPKINYHGSQPNAVIRETLQKSHIFAYPSIWMETSCIALIEAMSAGLHCVHPNFGALAETAYKWTFMYQFQENPQKHAELFYQILYNLIKNLNDPSAREAFDLRLIAQKRNIDTFHNLDHWKLNWVSVLNDLIGENPDRSIIAPKQQFVYRTS